MKKIITFVGLLVLCLSLVACGSKSTTNKTKGELIGNKVFSDEKMVTVTGGEIDMTAEYDAGRLLVDTNVGVGVLLPEDICGDMRTNGFVPLYQYDSSDNQMDISYIGETLMGIENADDMSEEEYMKLFLTMDFPLFAVHKASIEENSVKSEIYDSFEEIGVWNGTKYFILFNKNINEDVYSGLTERDKQNINKLIDAIPNLKKEMLVFAPVDYEDNMATLEETQAFASFKAQDVFGNEVTDKIIKENDITMINIWATWCGPCVMEMEDLGKLYANLPVGAGLISICEDADEEAEVVKDILKENNCKFPTLVPSGEIETYINEVYSYPTTIFVDNNGTIVDITTGSMDADGYMSTINRLLKQ